MVPLLLALISAAVPFVCAAAVPSVGKLNVLFVSMPASPIYNQIAMASEMQERGHQVTVASFEGMRERVTKRNVPFLSLSDAVSQETIRDIGKMLNEDASFWHQMKIVGPMFRNISDTLAVHVDKHLSNPKTAQPDIIVVTVMLDSIVRTARARGIPAVYTFPSVSVSPLVTSMPYVPALRTLFPLHGKTTLQRFLNLLPLAIFNYIPPHYLPLPHDPKLFASSMKIVASAPGFDYPHHSSPLVQQVGPLVRPDRMDPSLLPSEISDWISQSDLPIIYASMGTVVDVTVEKAVTFFDALVPPNAKPRWRVLWALPKDHQARLPKRAAETDGMVFRMEEWLTTPAVLSHPMVKAFFTHCGGNGVHESLYAGTPIVGVPYAGDQADVCARAKHSQTGLSIAIWEVTTADLKNAFDSVLNDKVYHENTLRVKALFKRSGGLQRAADLIEMVYELKGDLSLLQTPADTEGFVKAFCLDFIAAFVALAFVIGCMCGRCCCSRSNKRPAVGGKKYR